MVLINKAEGNLLQTAKHTKSDYSASMQFIKQKYPTFWVPPVFLVSALTEYNMVSNISVVSVYYILYTNIYVPDSCTCIHDIYVIYVYIYTHNI